MPELYISDLHDELIALLTKYNASITMNYDMRTEERSLCLEMTRPDGTTDSMNMSGFYSE